MKNLIYTLSIIFFVNAVVNAQNEQVYKPEVKLGVILPLSGSYRQVGESFRNACIMAREDAERETDGKLKYSYEFFFEDDEIKPSKVATVAQKLINITKADTLISTWSYGGTIVSPLAEKASLPHFGVAWDPMVAKGKFNFLYLTPPEVFIAKILDGFEAKKYKKIWAFGVQESGTIAAIEELKKQAPARGMEVVGESIVNINDQDFRSILAKVSRQKVDVFYANLISELESFKQQAAELKISTPILAMTGYDALDNIKPFEGSWYVSDTYVSDEFNRKYIGRFNSNTTYGVGNYYDIVRMIIWAYEHGDGKTVPSGSSILEYLKDLPAFKSIFGSISISPEGVFKYPAKFMIIKNGQREAVDSIE